jgi:hypothetical protein
VTVDDVQVEGVGQENNRVDDDWQKKYYFENVLLVCPILLPIFFLFFYELTRVGCRNQS